MSTYLIAGRLVAGGGLAAGQITVRRMIPKTLEAELVLNDAESIRADVRLPLRDPQTGATIDLPQVLIPGRDFIGVVNEWVEEGAGGASVTRRALLGAGPLWTDPFSFPTTSTLNASGLWSYFDHRYVLPILNGRLPRDVTSKWAGLSLRTIVKRLVQQACSHAGAALPIDYEPDFEGDHEREYPGSDELTVGDALRNLTAVEDGPEITFRPYLTEDGRHVRWALLTGDRELTQSGAPHYWDASVVQPYATIPELTRDGRELSSRAFTSGAVFTNLAPNGSFEDGLTGWAGGTNAAGARIATDGAAHGGKYARWQSVAAGVTFLDAERSTSAAPGDRFTVTLMGRGPSSRGMRTMMRFRNQAGEAIAELYGPYTAMSDTWAEVAHVGAVAPANTSSVQLFIEGNASAAAQVFSVDAIMFTLSAEKVPFGIESTQIQAVATRPELTDAGFPLLESWDDRASVLRESTLQAYSDEAVTRGSAHITTRTVLARRDAEPKLGTYLPGDYAKVTTPESPREKKSTVTERIIRISFGMAGQVTVELAPQRTVSGYPIPSSDARWITDMLRALSTRIAESNRRRR